MTQGIQKTMAVSGAVFVLLLFPAMHHDRFAAADITDADCQ